MRLGRDSRSQAVVRPRTNQHEQTSHFSFLSLSFKVVALLVLYALGVGPAWRLACYHQGLVADHILDLYVPLHWVVTNLCCGSYALQPLFEWYLALWGVVSGVNY